MSAQSVLFDLPGPKARRRHLIMGIVGAIALLGLLAAMVWALRNELTPQMWAPFANPDTWIAYVLPGLWATVQAALFAVVLSGVIGVLLGMGRLSQVKIVSLACGAFVEFFRSVPVLMMMLFSYYFFIFNTPITGPTASLAGVVCGLTLYNSCVIAELVRSGVHSLPKGQTEAGLAIGMTRGQTLNTILLPQAITAMLPSLLSQLIVVLKDTALGYIITYPELLQAADRLSAVYGNLIVSYLVVGCIFIVLNYGLNELAIYVEKRLRRVQAGPLVTVGAVQPAPQETGPEDVLHKQT